MASCLLQVIIRGITHLNVSNKKIQAVLASLRFKGQFRGWFRFPGSQLTMLPSDNRRPKSSSLWSIFELESVPVQGNDSSLRSEAAKDSIFLSISIIMGCFSIQYSQHVQID